MTKPIVITPQSRLHSQILGAAIARLLGLPVDATDSSIIAEIERLAARAAELEHENVALLDLLARNAAALERTDAQLSRLARADTLPGIETPDP